MTQRAPNQEKRPHSLPAGIDPRYVLLTTADVRAMLGGVSEMTLWRLRQAEGNGFPDPIQHGRQYRWRLSEIQAYVDSLDTRQTAETAAA